MQAVGLFLKQLEERTTNVQQSKPKNSLRETCAKNRGKLAVLCTCPWNDFPPAFLCQPDSG